MEPVCRFLPSRGRAALLATACLIVPVLAAEPGAGIFDRELAKRYQGVEEAQELLTKGDEAYKDGKYAEAVEAYSGARELIPDAPATGPLRDAATTRFAQASVEQARTLAKKGDVAKAKAVVEKVLAKDVAPEDPGAIEMRDQLDDPIRTNPALTAEHAKDVDDVRKLLYTAEGDYNLGKFDQAKATYEKVLLIDGYNSAARRGLERVASAKNDYALAAHDQARAHMLNEVEAAWETQVPPDPATIAQLNIGPAGDPVRVTIGAKLDRIVLPTVSLEQVSLLEAIDYLRVQASTNDTTELDPSRKGINFTVNLGPEGDAGAKAILSKRFDLRLHNVPLSQVLKYVCAATGTLSTADEFSVVIRPVGSSSTDLVSRSYRVPPDFLSTAGDASSTDPGAAADPFSEKPADGGLLARRRGAREILEASGVTFPEGASATFNVVTNTLLVRNTMANQDLTEQIVEAVTKTEPVQVIVTVTMIKTEQRNLKELGFDWLLDDFNLGGGNFLSGGTQGTGGNLNDIAVPAGVTRKPITAGNRSGDEAIQVDGIDGLIATNNQGFARGASRAPGVLTVNGLLNGTSYQAVMRGLDQKKGIDLMTAPSTVTRSGQQASVRVVRELIYPSEYEPPELPNSIGATVDNINGGGVGGGASSFPVTPATPAAFKMREVGVVLEVLPTVSQDKHYVDVQLNPSITNFDGFVNFGSPINSVGQSQIPGVAPTKLELTSNAILLPIFSVNHVNTNLTIADGATVVIGGLVQETIQKVDDKTPILGELPVVGRLFQSSASAPVRKSVVFFVNVKLVDPTGKPINQP